MSKNISIELFRISGDSKSLDMIFSCPQEYYFDYLELQVRFVENGTFKTKLFDLSSALFSEDTKSKKRWVVRLPLDKLSIFVPAIYTGTFRSVLDEDQEETLDLEITDTAICSDVNHAYRCMLDDLLKEGRCDNISDDAIRKYLLLYGHQAALSVRDMDTAEIYFKLIGNCFSKCAPKDRKVKHVQSCNCDR